jgi:hypothetical protein
MATLTKALALAQPDPPRVAGGDAVEVTPRLIDEAPAELALCVYHSFTLGFLPAEARTRFRELLDETASRRELYFIEMSGSTQDAFVRLTTWLDGKPQPVQLAECPAHGQWLRWLT